MSVVPILGVVFHVSGVDSDTSVTFLRSVINLTIVFKLSQLLAGQMFG